MGLKESDTRPSTAGTVIFGQHQCFELPQTQNTGVSKIQVPAVLSEMGGEPPRVGDWVFYTCVSSTRAMCGIGPRIPHSSWCWTCIAPFRRTAAQGPMHKRIMSAPALNLRVEEPRNSKQHTLYRAQMPPPTHQFAADLFLTALHRDPETPSRVSVVPSLNLNTEHRPHSKTMLPARMAHACDSQCGRVPRIDADMPSRHVRLTP